MKTSFAFFAALMLSLAPLALYAEPLVESSPIEEIRLPGLLDTPVPLAANYSNAELVLLGVVYPTSAVLTLWGGKILPAPVPSIGSPDPLSIDYRVSNALHGDLETGNRFLGGVPDKSAYVLGVAPALYFVTASGYRAATGKQLFGFEGQHIYHSTLAFAEAYAWTGLLTNGAKFLVGRPRPYVALERDAYAWKPTENNLSFFSGHASLAFAAAGFLGRDISDGLYHRLLVDWEPVPRYLVGRVVPFTVSYGLAGLIAFSRVYDQQHYLSDVLIGATVGTLTTNLVYSARFDHNGAPRQRHAVGSTAATGTKRVSSTFAPALVSGGEVAVPGLGLSGSW